VLELLRAPVLRRTLLEAPHSLVSPASSPTSSSKQLKDGTHWIQYTEAVYTEQIERLVAEQLDGGLHCMFEEHGVSPRMAFLMLTIVG
jgi:hypothetical protein